MCEDLREWMCEDVRGKCEEGEGGCVRKVYESLSDEMVVREF